MHELWKWLVPVEKHSAAIQAVAAALGVPLALLALGGAFVTYYLTRQQVALTRDQLKLAKDQIKADSVRIANERAMEQARAWQRYRRDLAAELAQMPRFILGNDGINLAANGRATTKIINVGETAAMRVLVIDTATGTLITRQDRMEHGQGTGVSVEYQALHEKGITIRFQTMFGSTWTQNLRLNGNVLVADVIDEQHTYGPPEGLAPDDDDLQGVTT